MSKVPVKITETTVTNEDGRDVPGVEAECLRCGHTVQCYGTSDRSKKRALVMLRENCPEEETNFYYDEDEGEP